jgi:hypothetical protein
LHLSLRAIYDKIMPATALDCLGHAGHPRNANKAYQNLPTGVEKRTSAIATCEGKARRLLDLEMPKFFNADRQQQTELICHVE